MSVRVPRAGGRAAIAFVPAAESRAASALETHAVVLTGASTRNEALSWSSSMISLCRAPLRRASLRRAPLRRASLRRASPRRATTCSCSAAAAPAIMLEAAAELWAMAALPTGAGRAAAGMCIDGAGSLDGSTRSCSMNLPLRRGSASAALIGSCRSVSRASRRVSRASRRVIRPSRAAALRRSFSSAATASMSGRSVGSATAQARTNSAACCESLSGAIWRSSAGLRRLLTISESTSSSHSRPASESRCSSRPSGRTESYRGRVDAMRATRQPSAHTSAGLSRCLGPSSKISGAA